MTSSTRGHEQPCSTRLALGCSDFPEGETTVRSSPWLPLEDPTIPTLKHPVWKHRHSVKQQNRRSVQRSHYPSRAESLLCAEVGPLAILTALCRPTVRGTLRHGVSVQVSASQQRQHRRLHGPLERSFQRPPVIMYRECLVRTPSSCVEQAWVESTSAIRSSNS
ncbi:hypothetical protein VTN02DRAFT_2333 [Thermoascus thermophilus]